MSETPIEHSLDAIVALPKGDLYPLIVLLRADTPMHPELREMMAAALDPNSGMRWRLVWRRPRGRRCRDTLAMSDADRATLPHLLRAGGPLRSGLREMLAEALEQKRGVPWRLVWQLAKGRPTKGAYADHLVLGRRCQEKIERGGKFENAILEMMSGSGVTRSHATSSLAEWRGFLEIKKLIERDDDGSV